METSDRKTYRDKFVYYMWRNKENEFNRNTVPAIFISQGLLIFLRVIFLLVATFLLVLALYYENYKMVYYFTSWGIMLTFLTFLFLVIGHIIEY